MKIPKTPPLGIPSITNTFQELSQPLKSDSNKTLKKFGEKKLSEFRKEKLTTDEVEHLLFDISVKLEAVWNHYVLIGQLYACELPEHLLYEGKIYENGSHLKITEDEEILLVVYRFSEIDYPKYLPINDIRTPSLNDIRDYKQLKKKYKKDRQQGNNIDLDISHNDYPPNNYCEMCQQSPCMCSDPF